MNKNYSDQLAKYLFNKAVRYKHARKSNQALIIFNWLIKYTIALPIYYTQRAHIYGSLTEFSRSIEDIRIAISLDPDCASNYANLGGYLVSSEEKKHGKISKICSKKLLDEATNYYNLALEKDPTDECAWVNLIEVCLFKSQYDEAVSYFGSCKTFIKSLPFQLIRSFLGSLALILSGDEIDGDDMKILEDFSIRISYFDYRLSEAESFISDLERSGFENARVIKVKEIFNLFVSHYYDNPYKYGPRANYKL
jgi:tetratricopeptide (TPR) repeat protein